GGVRIHRLTRRLGLLVALEDATQLLGDALLLADAALALRDRRRVDGGDDLVDAAVDRGLRRRRVVHGDAVVARLVLELLEASLAGVWTPTKLVHRLGLAVGEVRVG